MPGPAVYVVAIISTVAVAIALKELYEPHIAPVLERWAENFLAKREARRRQRAGAIPVPVGARSKQDDRDRARLPSPSDMRRDSYDDNDNDDETQMSAYELEHLVAREVDEWRNQVSQVQTGLRQRRNASGYQSSNTLDGSIVSLPYTPMSPTHVITNGSSPLTTPTDIFARTPVDLPVFPQHLRSSQSYISEAPIIPSITDSRVTQRHDISFSSANRTPTASVTAVDDERRDREDDDSIRFDRSESNPFEYSTLTEPTVQGRSETVFSQLSPPPMPSPGVSPTMPLRSLSERYMQAASPMDSPRIVMVPPPSTRSSSPFSAVSAAASAESASDLHGSERSASRSRSGGVASPFEFPGISEVLSPRMGATSPHSALSDADFMSFAEGDSEDVMSDPSSRHSNGSQFVDDFDVHSEASSWASVPRRA